MPKSVLQNPVPVRLALPQANPDWNTATVKIPAASQYGWSGHSLQSYLQTFQRSGGPAAGQQIDTTQSLFPNPGIPAAPDWGKGGAPSVFPPYLQRVVGQPATIIPSPVSNSGIPVAPDWGKLPNVDAPPVFPGSGSSDIIQSLVKNSVGGEMSSAAAALYGRMLGATPPPVVAAAPKSAVNPNNSGTMITRAGGTEGFGRFRGGQFNQGFSAGQNALYKGMTQLQRQQANAVYNVTQPTSPTLR